MATPKYRGSAIDVRQQYTGTAALTWAQGDTITLTIDNLDFVITIGTLVTTTQVATTVKEAFNGSTLTDTSASCVPSIAQGGAASVGNFAEMTASSSAAVVTFITNQTQRVGKPITMTTGDVGATAGNGTFTIASSVTPHGKNEADNVDNYDINAIPADNDTLVFDAGSEDLLYDLLLTCQPTTIIKTKAYTGLVGLAEINNDNPSIGKSYREYRTKYLTTDDNSQTTVAYLETGSGQGSGRFRWDAGAGRATVNVLGRGTRADGVPCILFIGSNTANEVNNLAGDLGIAFFPGEAAVIVTLRNGDGPSSQANTECGSGCAFTSGTVTCNGGTLSTNSAIPTANQYGGTWTHNTGTITALNILGSAQGKGTFKPIGAATFTTLTIGTYGAFDATSGTGPIVITNTIQMYRGGSFLDPQGRCGNVVFKFNQCTPADCTIVIAPNKTITLS